MQLHGGTSGGHASVVRSVAPSAAQFLRKSGLAEPGGHESVVCCPSKLVVSPEKTGVLRWFRILLTCGCIPAGEELLLKAVQAWWFTVQLGTVDATCGARSVRLKMCCHFFIGEHPAI